MRAFPATPLFGALSALTGVAERRGSSSGSKEDVATNSASRSDGTDGAEAFEQLVGLLDYPMFVVTTRAGAERSGCLVGFTSQISIDPPRFLVGLSEKNHTYQVAREAERLVVHVLGRRDLELARLFGEETGDEIDKFDRCAWHDGPDGLPVLDDAPGWFSGRILERLPLGDHVAFLIEPDTGHMDADPPSLVTFGAVRHLEAGHEA